MEAQVVLARCLQERERALDIRSQKRRGVEDGVVIVALGGKVHDRIGIRSELIDELCVADIAMHEAHAVFGNAGDVVEVARVGKRVKYGHMNIGLVVDNPVHEVATNEARTTRDDDVLGAKRFCHLSCSLPNRV